MGRGEEEAHQEALRVGLFLIQTQEDLSGEISLVEETLNITQKRRDHSFLATTILWVQQSWVWTTRLLFSARQEIQRWLSVKWFLCDMRGPEARIEDNANFAFRLRSSRLLYFHMLVHLYKVVFLLMSPKKWLSVILHNKFHLLTNWITWNTLTTWTDWTTLTTLTTLTNRTTLTTLADQKMNAEFALFIRSSFLYLFRIQMSKIITLKNISLQPQTLSDFYSQSAANPGTEYLRLDI